ncbi:MAG: VTC domain-containing protein, partial [Micromonosporaceae bacterium]|nr:VTC domain-containing protein [Micromonosporaceae bacterium]
MTVTLDVSVVGSAVSGIEPISLEELNQQAALQTRVDRKYVLPLGEVEDLLQRIEESARVLEISELRSFGYESVYFDTLDWASYLLAAYRRRRRFKIRTRTYVDSGKCWLEVKTRGSR